MPRKIIFFGNGLGMALDADHFLLQNALTGVWNKEDFLREEQKQLIEMCIGRPGAPEGEHELDLLHRAVTYCKALNAIGDGEVHWLTPDGQNFPEFTSIYMHKVATRLHNYNGQLPGGFEHSLVEFIRNTNSHVATLNYDKLLYNSFIDNGIVGGYDRSLVDGMRDGGFSSEALERKYDRNYGFYLHLHGSPLFINKNGHVIKLSRDMLTEETNEPSEHIVLTHVKHKPSVIAASQVLSTYWDYLQFALSESEEIIFFGYSGFDDHLNVLLRPYLVSKQLRVVEWSGSGEQQEREQYWLGKLGHRVIVERLDNITDFINW